MCQQYQEKAESNTKIAKVPSMFSGSRVTAEKMKACAAPGTNDLRSKTLSQNKTE